MDTRAGHLQQSSEYVSVPSDIDLVEAKDVLHLRKSINVLAVEDDHVSMAFLEAQITGLGHKIIKAGNGEDALSILRNNLHNIDVVLMDKEMPVLDGLSTVLRMKEDRDLRDIPVVMVTGADSEAEMKAGMDAGVFYYLTKPVKSVTLRSVLSAAVRESNTIKLLHEELGKHKQGFGLIETCKFKFQTLEQAESLAAFMANCFPDPARAVIGLGELLINAIEHGNLGVGYDRKTVLVESNSWRSEVTRLQQSSEHCDKFASATIAHKKDGIYVVITDEGEGFQWRDYLKIDPARAGDNHGRGIAQANAISFDKLTYNPQGNQVVAFVAYHSRLDW